MSNAITKHTGQAITTRGPADDWQTLREQAQAALDSGFLPRSIQKPAQAIAIAMAGREIGIATMTAFRLIHIIEGKPSISAEGMLALAYQRVPGFGHQIVENSDTAAKVMMWRPGVEPTPFEFTRKQADVAGLTGKDVWKKYGPRMLLWRALKWGVQTIAPDVTLGMMSTDEAEEIAEDQPRRAPAPAPVTMVTAKQADPPPAGDDVEIVSTLTAQITEAPDEPTLRTIGKAILDANIGDDARKGLRAVYAKRRAHLVKHAKDAAKPDVPDAEVVEDDGARAGFE